ncbi:Putative uncharacterized protein [Moritella viscosa]|uniref:hypothetical protein n=1 Tax=Moritella viscosa TaxID=80854 RepID=UPI0005090E74|nr:hypothetical protein [Moritella viscosa]CED59175.1 putative uncharacterized protein [Moritella viscosa]SHO00175.1 Putative uncharacterized protein [Moritella viscosa]SHO20243.1 Putative uncharacterized protein [Moritella viscosa]
MLAHAKVKTAFDLVCSEYLDMFKTHYPKASGGGINEANQTYYFCKNLSQVINEGLTISEVKSAVSLETPYGSNKRMDGVVISPATREIFLIQAKRLKSSQMDSVIKDVNKVYVDRDNILNKIQISDNSIDYKVYLVILADMWLHKSKARKEANRLTIPIWWAGDNSEEIKRNFEDNEFKYTLLPPEGYFVDNIPKDIIWDNKNQLIHRFYDYKNGLASKKVLDEYCLFCGCGEI